MRLCSWCSSLQHWPQALMKDCGVCFLQYDLFILTIYSSLESATPNQRPLAEKEPPNNKLSPKCTLLLPQRREEEWGKGEGCEISKSIDSSLLLWFMSLLWLFSPDLWTKENGIFVVRSSSNYQPVPVNGNNNQGASRDVLIHLFAFSHLSHHR